MGKEKEVEGSLVSKSPNLEKAQGSNLNDRLKHPKNAFVLFFLQSADGGELRCETSGFETRTRNVCEEKFETECKTIQVYLKQDSQASNFVFCRFPRNGRK